VLASALDAGITRLLGAWDRLKGRYPGLSRRIRPILSAPWRLAVRHRPALAETRERRTVMSAWGSSPGREGSLIRDRPTGPAVDRRHVIEDRSVPLAARVEHAYVVPDIGVFISGWLFDPEGRIARLRVRAGDAVTDVEPADLARPPRPDVQARYGAWSDSPHPVPPGIAGLISLAGVTDESIAATLVVDLIGVDGIIRRLVPRPVIDEPSDPDRTIRDLIALLAPLSQESLDRHVGPAVSAPWTSPERSIRVVDLGTLPLHPRSAIVVPVLDGYELIEYQIALFADDPDLRDAELVYVIADPRIGDGAERLCRSIQPVFGMPFRIVLSGRDLRPAQAIEIGVDVSHAPLILLLDPRVMPVRPGWLAQLLEAYAAAPSPGLLGPCLLRFDRTPVDDPDLTSACLMVARDLYRQLGGVDEGFLGAGQLGADLSRRANRLGHDSRVTLAAELFDLRPRPGHAGEGVDDRESIARYDRWRYARLWAETPDGPAQAEVMAGG
jgi:O-antigen biosynthesis protein